MYKKQTENTNKSVNYSKLDLLSDKYDIKYSLKPNNHIQIHGLNLVNYYPLSKLKTAYMNNSNLTLVNISYEKAFKLANNKQSGVKECACGVEIIRLWSPDYITHVNASDKERHFCKRSN